MGPCPADLIDDAWTQAWQGRLECGRMKAPLYYDLPELFTVEVGLIRIRAGVPASKAGTLFFNFGGPGAHPAHYLPHVAATWDLASPESALDGDKHRLAAAYDLVAVIPRGLRYSLPFSCGLPPNAGTGPDPTIDLADWNWAGFLADARRYATDCGGQPLSRYAGTQSHVYDMELARRALGETTLNFYGVSYGSWVGARYAAAFPDHVGRFVLDSVMDYSGTIEAVHDSLPGEAQDLFDRRVLRAALADTSYGLAGRDAGEVMGQLKAMPAVLRRAWMARMSTPADLAAVLTLDAWVRDIRARWTSTEAWADVPTLLRDRRRGHRFSADARTNAAIGAAADALIVDLEPAPAEPTDTAFSAYFAVTCGDTPWRRTVRDWRRAAGEIGEHFPVMGGGGIVTGLICSHWPTASRAMAPLERLRDAPPMLLVQAEFDRSTPLEGALRAFEATPGARMIVSLGMVGHGVFGMSDTPCVERDVGRFLLTGALPTEPLTSCGFQPLPAARHARENERWPGQENLRETLRARLRRS